jgi:two-component system OmpR family response regulator
MSIGKSDRDSPLKVLVIEDDDGVARMLGIALRAAGFEVRRAATGAEALCLLEEEAPQAVILDLVLPDELGGAVLQCLRQVDPTDLPVRIVMSALDEREAMARYGLLGADFFAKPFDPEQLIRTLEQRLGDRRERRDPDAALA